MASVTYTSWNKDVSGSWTSITSWSNGLPDSGAMAAVLSAMPNAYTVTSASSVSVFSLEVDKGATLNIAAGVFTNYDSIYAYSNSYLGGIIDIAAAATMVFGRTGSLGGDSAQIDGTGTVKIMGGTFEVAAPNLAILGVRLVLSNNGVITAASSLSAIDHRSGVISGSGSIGAGTTFAFSNDFGAVINANGAAGAALTLNTGADAIVNAGLIESTGLGGLVIDGNLDNDGLLRAAKGGITINNGVVGSNGGVEVDAGASLILHDGIVATSGPLKNRGVVTTKAGDKIAIGSNNQLVGDALWLDVENAGAIDVVNNSTLNLGGFVDDLLTSASVNLMASGSGLAELVLFDGGASIEGGALTMSNSAGNEILSNGTGEQFSNYALLSGSGLIGDGYLRLFNGANGVVDANGSAGLTLIGVSKGSEVADSNAGLVEATGAGKLTIRGAFLNAGLIEAASVGGIILDGAQITAGGGKLVVAARGALFLENGTAITNQSQIAIAASGALSVLAGANPIQLACDIFASGAIDVAGGATLEIQDHFVSTASTMFNVGDASHGATIEVASGAFWDLSGAGTIDLANAGDRIIGADAGAQLWDKGVTIKGSGLIGDGTMSILVSNGGVIDATGALALDNNAAASANSGTLEATGTGMLTIMNALYSPGEIVANGGLALAEGSISGAGMGLVEGGGTLELQGADGNAVTFGAGGGTLQLDLKGSENGNIFGFAQGDTIDLRGFAFVKGQMAISAASGFSAFDGVLAITNGTATPSQSFFLEGNYTAAFLSGRHEQWKFANDGHNGTAISIAPA